MTKLFKSRNFLRVIVVLLFACFLGTAMSFLFNNSKKAEAATLTGAGTQASPYLIYTVQDLETLRNQVNSAPNKSTVATYTYEGSYFKLMADLDLAGVNWTPIGNFASTSSWKRFSGHFDGNNKVIKNLTINTAVQGAGLFGYCYGASIENLTIDNPQITSTKAYVGAFCGYFWGGKNYHAYVKNCHVKGGSIVSTGAEVGGIIGVTYGAEDQAVKIENCSVKGSGTNFVPTFIKGSAHIGGISGWALGAQSYVKQTNGVEQAGVFVTYCASTATVLAYNEGGAGGIIGITAGLRLDQCYSTGAIACTSNNGKSGYVGGIIGGVTALTAPGGSSAQERAARITNSFATGDVSVLVGYAGGISGLISINTGKDILDLCSVENCYYTGNVMATSSGNAFVGGIVGGCGEKTVYVGGCAVASERILGTGASTAISSPFASANAAVYPALIQNTKNVYNEDVVISERKGLKYLATNSITGDKVSATKFTTKSTYDKDLGWPMSSSNRIWNLSVNFNNGYPYLTGTTSYGASNNVLGTNVEYPYGSKYNPILINTAADYEVVRNDVNNATNLYSSLYLKQTADLDLSGSGILGTKLANSFRGTYDGNLKRLQNVDITATATNVGIFGYITNATFKNIIVEKANIYVKSGSINYAGILIGHAYGSNHIENCAIIGGEVATTTMSYVGGICGGTEYSNCYFERCFSSAEVKGGAKIGGITGYAVGTHISRCYTTGNITKNIAATALSVGGLIGDSHQPYGAAATITYAYDPALSGEPTALSAFTTVTNSYSSCHVTNKSTTGNNNNAVGGLIGKALSGTVVSNSYFNGKLETTSTGTGWYSENAGGIVGISENENVYINNCLSAIAECKLTSSRNYVHAGYFNTYTGNTKGTANNAATTIPKDSVNCFYVDIQLETFDKGAYGGAINNGTKTTLDDIKAGKIFTGTDSLGWDMTNIWTQKADLNDGFPMLKGLIVDTSDLLDVLNDAKKEDPTEWSEASYSALATAIKNAEDDIANNTITYESKAEHIKKITEAQAALVADLSALRELYDRVITEAQPYREAYLNYSLVASLLPGAREFLDAEPGEHGNAEVQSVYIALKVAFENLRINKTDLNKAIEEANAISLNSSAYPQEQVTRLETALKAAVVVNNNVHATAPEVKDATDNLNAAIKNMQLDKNVLMNSIIAAYNHIGIVAEYDKVDKDFVLNRNNEISSAWLNNYDAYEKALNTAKEVMADDKCTSQAILDAIFNLDYAVQTLTLDKTLLQESSTKAMSILMNEKQYTASSISALKTANNAAQEVLDNSTDKLVDLFAKFETARSNLNAALEGLVPNKEELERVIKKAETQTPDPNVYTGDTWDKLQTALTNAKNVFADDNAQVKDISKAISDLNDAMINLEVNLAYLKDLIAQASYILNDKYVKLLYTSGLPALQTRKEEAEIIYNKAGATTDEVKNAATKLKAALDALVVSTEQLEWYIDKSTRITTIEYTADSVEAFRKVAEEAQEKLSTMTNDEVVSYTFRLKALYDDLKANKDKLAELVSKINAMSNKKYRQDNDGNWIVDEDTGNMKVFVIYQADTWNNLQAELKKANDLLLNSKATPEEISAECTALSAAQDALLVDTSELELRMEKAVELLDSDLYTDETKDVLQEAYDAALELLESAEGEEGKKLELADVQKCLDALVAAINGMKADMTALEDLLDEASKLLNYKQYFTAASVKTLQGQYDQVDTLLKKIADSPDAEELDASSVALLAQLLTDAMKDLEIVTDELAKLIARYKELKADRKFITGFDNFESFATNTDILGLLKKGALDIKLYGDALENVTKYANALTQVQAAYGALSPNWSAFSSFITEYRPFATADHETVKELIDAADELYNERATNGATYEDVIASVHALQEALQDLRRDLLKKLIEDTQAEMAAEKTDLGESLTLADYYTTKSVKTLEGTLSRGTSVAADNKADLTEIEAAISAIETAKKGLIVDISRLKLLIEDCDTLYKEEYFEATSYEAYKTELDNSKELVGKPDKGEKVDLEDYIGSYKTLVDAISKLEYLNDSLDKIIAVAEATLENEKDNCTDSSVKALTDSLTFAKEYKAGQHSEKTNDEVCADLLAAIAGLVDISKLREQIAIVEPVVEGGNPDSDEQYFSEGSWNELVDLLAQAKSLITENPMQYEVDNIVDQLTNYATDILLNVTEAKKYVDEQNAFIAKNKGRYTDETWTPYTEAVEKLDSMIKLTKYEVSLEEIAEAKTAAEELFNALEEDLSRMFILKESNKTFKFLYGDFSAVDFATHQYDKDKPVYLTDVALGDSISDILAQFENIGVKVYDSKGNEITDFTRVIATGMVFKLMAGDQVLDEITIAIKGDINGDGLVATVDKAQLNAYTSGTNPLTGAFLIACDINGDGVIATVDKAQLNAYTGGTNNIYAGKSVKGAA